MPLPRPAKGDKQSAFISRCMGSAAMNKEFPKQKQRAAVCYSQWRRRNKKTKWSKVL